MLTPVKADYSDSDIPPVLAVPATATAPAPDSARPNEVLHSTAQAADRGARNQLNLAMLWRELARGQCVVVDGFFSDERCYLVVAHRAKATPIPERRLEILEAVLGGVRQKHIAIDFKLAPSTVALNSRLGLEALGVDGKPSRAHPLLMLAARAGKDPTILFARCATFVASGEDELRVISVRRPDLQLTKLLPRAELAVIGLLLEGLSYEEIAATRGTSTRTIANQITAVFRRLRVSGRNELVQRLFIQQAKTEQQYATNETLAPPSEVATSPIAARYA